jgi:hypothetical protein
MEKLEQALPESLFGNNVATHAMKPRHPLPLTGVLALRWKVELPTNGLGKGPTGMGLRVVNNLVVGHHECK